MLSEPKNQESAIPLLDVEAQEAATGADFKEEASYENEAPAVPTPAPTPAPKSTGAGRKFLIWTAINMLATIGIVFTNKAIFNDPDFKLMQTSFASFHFLCTGLTLWVVSRPRIGAFVPKQAGIVEMLPVSHKILNKRRWDEIIT
jgi:solute carrier family 35 protein E3